MCLASLDRTVLSNTFHLSGDTFRVSPLADFVEKDSSLREA
jgi:hypothetical protein